MGRKLNLSHLSEGECRQILDVIQRDYTIRQKEKERLTKLQKLVKDEEQKRLVLSRQKQFNEKYCICCFSSFGLIFNKRTECKSCGFFICRDCSVKPEGMKDIMCLGCMQQRELQVQVCEWFYGQIRNRFRRFGSAKVVRSLYKRDSQSSDSFDRTSNDSGVHEHQLSPPAREMLPEEASKVFLETLEKQTSTANKDLLGIPYKALLENPNWLPLVRPPTTSVGVQAPEDVLSDVLDSRQALEDFVFNLPPEEEELDKGLDHEKRTARRHSGPQVVILDPEGEPVSKTPESNRKVHFGDIPMPAKAKDASLASSSTTAASGAGYHILSPIEEVLSSPELVEKCADANGNKLDASSGCIVKDRGSIDRLSLGEEERRARADSSSTISPHDWDSGIHMSLCLSQDGGWEVSQSTSSGTDSLEGAVGRDVAAQPGSLQSMTSDSVDSFASMSLASLDANDTLDSLETHYNSIHSDTLEVSDEFVSSSSTLVENRNANENDESMSGIGIEIEQLTLSRSSSEETLKTDDEDDIDGKVGDLTMEEFLDQLTSLSLSANSENADLLIKDSAEARAEDSVSPPLTEETSLASSSEEAKQNEIEILSQRMKLAEESQPLLGEEEEEFELPKADQVDSLRQNKESERDKKSEVSQEHEGNGKLDVEDKHIKCTKIHHHHSNRSHVHDPTARSKSPYKRSKSNDDFILSGRSGDLRGKSNGSKSHRRDGEPVTKCTKESHHHGKHHERSPSNRFVRYDSLPLVVEVFEAEGNYHWHHHSHRDFRQFSRESDSNDSEPSNQAAGKTSRSGAKLVRAAHLSPKSSYEEETSQSRQLSMESNTTEDTMPKSTSQSSGPTTPESRRDSQQMAGLSSEDSSKEEQRSPDKPLHYSTPGQGNSIHGKTGHGTSNLSPVSMDYPIMEKSIQDAIDSLLNVDQGKSSQRKSQDESTKKDEQSDSMKYQPEGNDMCQKDGPLVSPGSDYSLESPSLQRMPQQPLLQTSPSQLSPLASLPHLPVGESHLQPSPCTPPAQLSPGASPKTTHMGMASLRKDIQELANLTKKVSMTQEEMLQSAEEVLTSAHKMSSIQNQVEELEDVLDSLERTVIGDSSSLYGSSSSENEDSVVGPQEQVVEDMQLLEQQLANSHTEATPSESNAATAVRMITTTALKLLSTTEDAMKSHSDKLASPTSCNDSCCEAQTRENEGHEQEIAMGQILGETGLSKTGSCDLPGYSHGSSEEEEMCACSSSDGSRPSSLTLDDVLSRNENHSHPQNSGQDLDGCSKSKSTSHQSEKLRNPSIQGVSILHLHPSDDQHSPPIATLMCEIDEDVRNGNGISAAGSPYQNGDSAMFEETTHKLIPSGAMLVDSTDLTFDLDEDQNKDKAAERRRRKERKLRKSSGYKTSPTREQERNLLLYNQMADLEEKVYLSAGKVFTLEERLQQLQERVSQVDRTSPEENIIDLEDKIALTMAQVAQSESQVAAVEAQIAALQRSREEIMEFNTVSVAMCDLSSPENYRPFTYGSSVQIQIPRERVDSPVDFVLEGTPQQSNEYNNNKNEMDVAGDEVELEMGVVRDEAEVNGGQTETFGVGRCEIFVKLRPISAIIIRYLQEGDDDTLWPDFRFNRNKLRKHDGEKRPKLEVDSTGDRHTTESNSEANERHISTLEVPLGFPDELPVSVLDGQEVDLSLPINEIDEVWQA